MSSIKQVIIAAINKVSSAPEYAGREYATAEDAREDFIRALIAELFPESEAASTQEVVVPVSQQTLPERVAERKATKEEKAAAKAAKEAAKAEKAAAKEAKAAAKEAEKKAKSPKKSPEEKAAEKEAAKEAKAAAKEAEKKAKAEAKEAEKAAKAAEKALKVAEKVKASPKASPEEKKEAKAAAKEAEKVAKAAAKEAEKAAKAAEKAASKIPLPASPKPKKAKAPEGANLPKIDPTWRKHLKKADKEHAKELEPALLTYLNAMTAEEFNSKTAEEHVATFLTKKPEVQEDDGKVEADLEEVDFEGKTYYVNPETKRVYEGEGVYDEEVGWTNYKPVGYVGMAAFAEMKLDA